MIRAGHDQRRPQDRPSERRKDALLLSGSLLAHIVLFLLLPGLATPVQDHVELIVELLDARPATALARMAADGGGSSPAVGTAESVSEFPAAAGPARSQQSSLVHRILNISANKARRGLR